MKEVKKKIFSNGQVWLLKTEDGYPVEVTDTFLPFDTKFGNNKLSSYDLGSRYERWMVGVSTMSGCPVRCKFCATGQLKKWRNLTAKEIVQQVEFVLDQYEIQPEDCKEFKINYTRMGEPFLNIENVKEAISLLDVKYKNIHHYVSSIGIRNSDFSWIKDNITLQFSVHSTNDERRNWLIPFKKKMSLEKLGQVSTKSSLKTTINMTLVEEEDFDGKRFLELFDKDKHFVKLSPINTNAVSEENCVGNGAIIAQNLM